MKLPKFLLWLIIAAVSFGIIAGLIYYFSFRLIKTSDTRDTNFKKFQEAREILDLPSVYDPTKFIVRAKSVNQEKNEILVDLPVSVDRWNEYLLKITSSTIFKKNINLDGIRPGDTIAVKSKTPFARSFLSKPQNLEVESVELFFTGDISDSFWGK